MNASLMMNQKPPALYSAIMTAGRWSFSSSEVIGYTPAFPIGSLSNNSFPPYTITRITYDFNGTSTHRLHTDSTLPAGLKIKINGSIFPLNSDFAGNYTFSENTSSLFVVGQEYQIEIIN